MISIIKPATHFLLASAVLVGGAFADDIVSNFGNPFTPGQGIGLPDGGSTQLAGQRLATSFTTDNQSYRLDSIGLSLFASNNNDFDFVSRLRADDRGLPGNIIVDFVLPASSPCPTCINTSWLPPAAAVTLDPNTTYWVTIGNELSAINTLTWNTTDSPQSNGPAFLNRDLASSTDFGAVWIRPPLNGVITAPILGVVGAPIPEPIAFSLVGAGIAGLILLRRRAVLSQD